MGSLTTGSATTGSVAAGVTVVSLVGSATSSDGFSAVFSAAFSAAGLAAAVFSAVSSAEAGLHQRAIQHLHQRPHLSLPLRLLLQRKLQPAHLQHLHQHQRLALHQLRLLPNHQLVGDGWRSSRWSSRRVWWWPSRRSAWVKHKFEFCRSMPAFHVQRLVNQSKIVLYAKYV